MRTILKTLESPNKRHQLKLQRRTSLMDIANGTPNDDFYLLITNKSVPPVIRALLRRNVKIGHSFYEPAAQAFLNPYGNVIEEVQINPQEKHICITLLRRVYEKTHSSGYKETKTIHY